MTLDFEGAAEGVVDEEQASIATRNNEIAGNLMRN